MTRAREDAAKLFAYNRWAYTRMLDAVGRLTAEEFIRPMGGSFGSVQATLAHLYGADRVWLERLHGRSPRELPASREVPTLQVLREEWDKVQQGHRAFVETLTPDRMAEPLTYVNFKGETWIYPLGEALVHVANHGTYHRGQVATLLRQLGKTPASTDYLLFLDATR